MSKSSSSVRPKLKFIGAVEDEWQLFRQATPPSSPAGLWPTLTPMGFLHDLYSDSPSAYTIGAPIGFGSSSIVYAATYHPHLANPAFASAVPRRPPPPSHPAPLTPPSIECALKVIDLDVLPLRSLQLLKRETQLMSLSKHPNVLRVRGTWMTGHKLYIAMRLMKSGSVADVMRYGYPDGLEEEVCRCVLKQALEGLTYLHTNGFIHRDLKAANLLIDEDGTVLLGDLGVAVSLADEDVPVPSKSPTTADPEKLASRSRLPNRLAHQRGKRRSFVGTPCWMAPEVVSQKHYDAKADIWSFGITALELTLGRAPRSRDPPHKVLMKTLNEAPPTVDRENGPHKYSKAFQEMVASCLVKDPAQRPTAQQLLQSPFFKGSVKKGYLVSTILKSLPPLATRQERTHQPAVSAVSSVASWDFDPTPYGTPPSTPKRRKAMNLFLDTSSPDKGRLQLQDEFERPDSTPDSPQPSPPTTEADSPIATPDDLVESESSESSPSPVSQSPKSHIFTSSASAVPLPPLPSSTPRQGGMWKKLTGSRKFTESDASPQAMEKGHIILTRTLSSRFGQMRERTMNPRW